MSIKPKILFIGGNLSHTSFGRISYQIISGLSLKYEVHQLCISDLTLEQKNNPLYHEISDIRDFHGKKKLLQLLLDINPDALFIYSTLLGLSRYLDFVYNFFPELQIIAYCAIENKIIRRKNIISSLTRLSKLVVFSNFARDEFKRAFEDLKIANSIPPIEVIPHGVDTDSFYPINHNKNIFENRSQARHKAFGELNLEDAFIVLNRNVIQSRKRIDITMKAFQIFSDGKPKNIYLCLHPGKSAIEKNRIQQWASSYNIDDRIIMDISQKHSSCNDDILNYIYNACDVGINTSGGEGWGLVSFEHAATGAAQIVPNHSCCSELWSGFAETINPIEFSYSDDFMHQMHYVSAESVANILESLYMNKDYLTKLSSDSYQNSIKPEFQWTNIHKTWLRVLDDTLAKS